jgi:exodeoxyribonuclease V beta subunit
MEEFNLNKAPLEGTNLIEAGAGTGKTYNIAGLYVRLILEKKLRINEILVVTFTKAATEELKDRIRNKIRQTISSLTTGRSDDSTLAELIRSIPNKNEAKRRLKSALVEFDEAAIFTIHGFCQRILHDNSFESGGLFDTELITDQSKLLRETVDDFWRKRFDSASLLLINYMRGKKSEYFDNPEKLLELVGNLYARPFLKVIPSLKPPDTKDLEIKYLEAFKIVEQAWPSAKNEVESTLKDSDQLNRNTYRKTSVILWLKQMDLMLSTDGDSPALFDKFVKFTTGEIEKGCKKNCKPPDLPFFGLCDKLWECSQSLCLAYDSYLLALKTELFDYLRQSLAERKLSKNVQYYDDLLSKMYAALHGAAGIRLAATIRNRYKAALIDEFQDTDPIQYDIFKTIYSHPDSVLFLIGDPKQAIYGFRGADIFAYMKAIDQVDNRYTLTKNWRSEPGLIDATNEIFGGAERPFIYDKIPFIRAVPSEDDKRKILLINGKTVPQFNFWFIDSGSLEENDLTKGLIKKEAAYNLLTGAVSSEISNLLMMGDKNKIIIGEQSLQAGDIAVLVRTNKEARMIKDALAGNNIPCVLYSTESVFDTDEALAIERLLAAIANPKSETLVKTALTSNIIGIKGEALFDLEQDSNRWEIWLHQFKDYNDIWNEQGFISMFSRLLSDHKVRSRFLSLPDGERRVTNILHIAEILHRQESENKLGIAGLLKWLVLQKSPDAASPEYHQLRLESDENAVKIVTIHKSKGLEYPIVICPFVWGSSRLKKNRDNIFHDAANDNELTLDLGSENYDSHKDLAEKELLAENLRLLYVALTRARHRCYLAWGKFNQAGSSALAWLLHQPQADNISNIIDTTENRFNELDDSDIRGRLDEYKESAKGAIELLSLPAGREIKYLPPRLTDQKREYRKFSGSIDYHWRISSFSHLISGKTLTIELPDYDSPQADLIEPTTIDEEPALKEKPSGIFAFPKGAVPGTFCHDLFEHLDFKNIDNSRTTELVVSKLKTYGFDINWQDTIIEILKKVLTARLSSNSDSFSLSQIESKSRLNELEFYFPLNTITPDKLREIFLKHGGPQITKDFPETIGRLDFSPVRGFMKGYIDLVFRYNDKYYIIDWKSNHLGNRPDDYNREKLAEAMAKSFYTLQYHIYAIAINKYLSLRQPGYDYDTHFGGVFYIFLRGVEPELGNNSGIFYDKPSADLINELSRLLIDEKRL